MYVLPKSAATTKMCRCGIKNDIKLSDRTYTCPSCGYSQDRDVHAAQNMILMGVNTLLPYDIHNNEYAFVPLDQRDVKPVEMMSDWDTSVFQQLSAKQEAASSLDWQ